MFTRAMLVVWLGLMLWAGSAVALDVERLPPHPRLLFNRQGLEQFRQKVQRAPWDKVWAKLTAELDKELKKPLRIPPRGGNWSHNYVCPTHGARLKQGRQIGDWQWEHRCPVGPHVLRGDPSQAELDFDGNAIMSAHGRLAQTLRDLGSAYQVTGNERYAQRAREILLAYAENYLSFPRHDNRGRLVTKGGGRVASQSLTEASWLVPMAQGADLIWETLSETQREAVRDGLFRPAIDETILNASSKPVTHNIQCHRNSAVGLVGLLLGDAKLIDHAIDGISGYRANMTQGVQADGVWFEGAWGYHFFTLSGTWPLTEAARNCGLDLYGPEFKRLLDAPLNLAMPNSCLPAFNDSGEVNVAAQDEIYELGYARYQAPAYAALLAASKRASRQSLWFGVDSLAGASLPQSASRNAEASGYAILQQGEGRQATWLCLKYGEHGGGHGHYDKNHFVLYAGGSVLVPDSGSHAYSSPLHKAWDKTSFAHNTLVVDETSQAKATGQCLCFGSDQGLDYAMIDAGDIYRGVQFVRTVAMIGPQLVIFVDHVRGDKPRTLDLVCHHRGKWDRLPPGTPYTPPKAPGYQYLREATTRSSRESLALDVQFGDGQTSRIVLASREPTEVITGTGIGVSTEDHVPVVVFRRVAEETTYAWAVALGSAAVTLEAETSGSGRAMVTAKTSGSVWRLTSDPAARAVRVSRP